MQIAAWKKPGTNDTRIYFNGVSSEMKVFAVQQETSFVLKFSGSAYNSQKDSIMDKIDIELADLNGGERVTTWAELLAIVS